jgi:hypothetical protein
MNNQKQIEQRFWDAFSWVDLDEGELMPYDAVKSHELLLSMSFNNLLPSTLLLQIIKQPLAPLFSSQLIILLST